MMQKKSLISEQARLIQMNTLTLTTNLKMTDLKYYTKKPTFSQMKAPQLTMKVLGKHQQTLMTVSLSQTYPNSLTTKCLIGVKDR